MGRKYDILDTIQRLERNIKRKSSPTMPDTYGRSNGKTLRLIEKNDGIVANDLALLLDIRPSSLTHKLNMLEQDGNIRRVRDRRDARIVHIYITDKGREALVIRDQERELIKRDFSDCLSEEEKEMFCEICNRLSDSLEKIREENKALHADIVILNNEKQNQEETEIDEEANNIG